MIPAGVGDQLRRSAGRDPAAVGLDEHESRTRKFKSITVITARPNHDGVAVNRYGAAEFVARRGVGGGQRGRSAGGDPGVAGLGKYVGRTGISDGIAVGVRAVIRVRPDHNRVTVHRYGIAELVLHRGVGSGKLGWVSQIDRVSAVRVVPSVVRFDEKVRSAFFAVVERRANDYGLTVEGYRASEPIILNNAGIIACPEPVLLGPHTVNPAEYEGRSGIRAAFVIIGHADHSDVASHRHGIAELIVGGSERCAFGNLP